MIIKDAECQRCGKHIKPEDKAEIFYITTINKQNRFYLCNDCNRLIAAQISDVVSLNLRETIKL